MLSNQEYVLPVLRFASSIVAGYGSCSTAERQHSCFQIHRHSGDSKGRWAHQTVNVELRGFWVAGQQSRLLPELLRAEPESTQPNLFPSEVAVFLDASAGSSFAPVLRGVALLNRMMEPAPVSKRRCTGM